MCCGYFISKLIEKNDADISSVMIIQLYCITPYCTTSAIHNNSICDNFLLPNNNNDTCHEIGLSGTLSK